MKFASAFLATTLVAGVAGQNTCPATCNVYAGYQATTDVEPHSFIGVDAEDIYNHIEAGEWADAKDVYENGKNSIKSDSSIRTIKGFSVNSNKFKGANTQRFANPFEYKYGSTEWGHNFVIAALDDDSLDSTARKEYINKGMVYNNINQYVIHEMIDALNDCKADDLNLNDGAVKAWDEAVAFWVGSNNPISESSGYLGYAVTEKRADNFQTLATDTVTAAANAKIMELFNTGAQMLADEECKGDDEVDFWEVITDIQAQMTVFAVQGTLRYAYKNEKTATDGLAADAKERAEGTVFMRAVAPIINAFDSVQADILFDSMEADNYNPTVATYDAVFAVFEKTLHGLGLSCADINFLEANTAASACIDPDLSDESISQPTMAGYVPGSNVLDHSRIDLDVAYMDMYLETNDFISARHIYENGRFSNNGDRNMQKFSKKDGNYNPRLDQVPLFETYKNYWGSGTYADDFVLRAFEQQDEFAGASPIAIAEGAIKGAVYQNIYMYVLREFWDGIEDCDAGTLNDNDDGVHAWDEGVAFYVGQLEYADDSGPGVLGWKLGDKRCSNFDTCDSSGLATVNKELRKAFNSGRTYLEGGECVNARGLMPEIQKQMSIPLIQGALRYAYKVGTGDDGEKERAEGWAFAAAVLPVIDACSSDAATYIKNAMKFSTSGAAIDYEKVYYEFRSTFDCLDITCEDVGELAGVNPATNLCTDDVATYKESLEGSSATLKLGVLSSVLVAMTAVILA